MILASRTKQEATFTVDKTLGETKSTIENIIPDIINSFKFRHNKKLEFYNSKTVTNIRFWGEN
jgi:hypothetical protein